MLCYDWFILGWGHCVAVGCYQGNNCCRTAIWSNIQTFIFSILKINFKSIKILKCKFRNLLTFRNMEAPELEEYNYFMPLQALQQRTVLCKALLQQFAITALEWNEDMVNLYTDTLVDLHSTLAKTDRASFSMWWDKNKDYLCREYYVHMDSIIR